MKIRSEEDRKNLREGGRRLGTILTKVAQRALPGTTLKELDAYAEELVAEMGDKPAFKGFGNPPFPAVLCLSVNQGLVHGIPTDYALAPGDVLKIDGGIWHEGLCTDSAITVGIGELSQEDKELIWATQEALDAQIAVAIAGNTIGDIGHAAESVAKKYNLGFPKELGGHGVGLGVHEKPFVYNYGKPGRGEVLELDMVIALEPMFARGGGAIRLSDDKWTYEMKDGSRSAHCEHTVIVGESEAEVLTVRTE